MPAADEDVIARRFFIALKAKRGIGDEDAVEDLTQRHGGGDVGRYLAAQRTQHVSDQLWPWVFASGVVNHLTQGLNFPLLQLLQHGLLQGLPVIGAARRRAFQQ